MIPASYKSVFLMNFKNDFSFRYMVSFLFLQNVVLTIKTGDGDLENRSPVETVAMSYPGV